MTDGNIIIGKKYDKFFKRIEDFQQFSVFVMNEWVTWALSAISQP